MKTLEEIQKIREEKRKELDLRVNLKADTTEKHILVCRGTGCTSSKSPKIIEELNKAIEDGSIIGEIGYAHILSYAWNEKEDFSDGTMIGWLDEKATELYYPIVLDGRMPEKENEISKTENKNTYSETVIKVLDKPVKDIISEILYFFKIGYNFSLKVFLNFIKFSIRADLTSFDLQNISILG